MRVRLIHLRTRRDGAVARREEVRDVDEFSIGRGTDNALQLSGLWLRFNHLRIRHTHDGFELEPFGEAPVDVDGKPTVGCRVGPGAIIDLGVWQLRLLEPPADVDLVIEVERLGRKASLPGWLTDPVGVGLRRGALPIRPAAWLITSLALALLVLVPLLAKSLRRSWVAGPSSSAHAVIAADCERCHEAGFTRVRESTCLTCHSHVGAHVSAAVVSVELADARCASCHVEHQGATGLVQTADRVCVDCHVKLDRETAAATVSSFSRDHAPFRLTISSPDGESTRAAWSAALRERSGLRFNHLAHVARPLTVAGTDDRRILRCDDCHLVEPVGGEMLPVSFISHCSDCHSLAFDTTDGERQAQHAPLDAVARDIAEYYARRFLEGSPSEVSRDSGSLPRGIPGVQLTEPERRGIRERVERATTAALEFLTAADGNGPCAQCHELESDEASGRPLVGPVTLTRDWMPHARFAHRAHTAVACARCHPAAAVHDPEFAPTLEPPIWARAGSSPYGLVTPERLAARYNRVPSTTADDINMPTLSECRECHGGDSSSTSMVVSECGMCHWFHRPSHGSWSSGLPATRHRVARGSP